MGRGKSQRRRSLDKNYHFRNRALQKTRRAREIRNLCKGTVFERAARSAKSITFAPMFQKHGRRGHRCGQCRPYSASLARAHLFLVAALRLSCPSLRFRRLCFACFAACARLTTRAGSRRACSRTFVWLPRFVFLARCFVFGVCASHVLPPAPV